MAYGFAPIPSRLISFPQKMKTFGIAGYKQASLLKLLTRLLMFTQS